MPFKVIQGHRFWYQSKAHMRLPIIGADSMGTMGAIAPALQNPWGRRHCFRPTGFWGVRAIVFLVYFVFINVCLVCYSVSL